MRINIILRETCRSFFHNVYINLLLIVEFAICFFLLITIMTFYLEIGNNDSVNQIQKFSGRKWYEVRIDGSKSLTNITDIAAQPDGLERIRNFYNEINDNPYFEYISYRDGQNIMLDSSLMNERFGEDNYRDLLASEGLSSENACYKEMTDGGREYISVDLKSVQMNLAAYKEFTLPLSEGEGWTAENMTMTSSDSAMPLILGSAYHGKFKVGETIRLQLPTMGALSTDDWFYNARVVGILDEDAWMPSYDGAGDIIYLTDYVLCPVGMNILYMPDTAGERSKLTSGQYSDSLLYSYITLKPNVDYSRAILKVSELSDKYDVYHLRFTSTSFGMDLLKNETETTIAILSVLTAVMVLFTLFCLISSAVSRLQKNMRVYAIYLANGAGMGNILVPYLLEMILLLLPAIAINILLLGKKMYFSQNYAPLNLLIGMALVVYVSISIFISRKLSGIDTEELMRRKE